MTACRLPAAVTAPGAAAEPRSAIGTVLVHNSSSRLVDADKPTGDPIRYVRDRLASSSPGPQEARAHVGRFGQLLVSGHGGRFIELPVGEAGQVEATLSMARRKGRHSGEHVLPDDPSVFVLECVSSNPRSDRWPCTAESIEFLSAEEQLSARFGRHNPVMVT